MTVITNPASFLRRVGNQGNLLKAKSGAWTDCKKRLGDFIQRSIWIKSLDRFYVYSFIFFMQNNNYAELTARAEALVKEHIQGTRKGLADEPNYLHSYRVRDLVSNHHHWDDPDYDLFLAALLHDIIEDGGITPDALRSMGFSERTITLVELCTHRLDIQDKTERWIMMIAKLVEAADEDAWRIKLADLTDNLTECHGLSPENRVFMIEVKAPLLLRLAGALPFSRVIREEYPYVEPSIFALQEEIERQKKQG